MRYPWARSTVARGLAILVAGTTATIAAAAPPKQKKLPSPAAVAPTVSWADANLDCNSGVIGTSATITNPTNQELVGSLGIGGSTKAKRYYRILSTSGGTPPQQSYALITE